nr:zinc ribbon domain-containing protein [Chloroflexota bacterium]
MVLPATIKTIISFVLILLGAYAVLFLFSLIIWTFRDIRSRTRDVLVQILATLLVLVFNIPGLLLYFVLRPQETLTEAYEHALGQEALLQDIEERYICPSCKRKAEADFIICPYCHAELRKRCPNCERLMSLSWDICPYCGQQQNEEQLEGSNAPVAPTSA